MGGVRGQKTDGKGLMKLDLQTSDMFFENYKVLVSKIKEAIIKNQSIALNCNFEYLNTAYSTNFLKILVVLEDYKTIQNDNVIINFFYRKNDLDMIEFLEELETDEPSIYILLNCISE